MSGALEGKFCDFCYFDLSVLEGYFGDCAHCYVDLKLLRLGLEEKQDTFAFTYNFTIRVYVFTSFWRTEIIQPRKPLKIKVIRLP